MGDMTNDFIENKIREVYGVSTGTNASGGTLSYDTVKRAMDEFNERFPTKIIYYNVKSEMSRKLAHVVSLSVRAELEPSDLFPDSSNCVVIAPKENGVISWGYMPECYIVTPDIWQKVIDNPAQAGRE